MIEEEDQDTGVLGTPGRRIFPEGEKCSVLGIADPPRRELRINPGFSKVEVSKSIFGEPGERKACLRGFRRG